jgi:hypothetical protein
MKYCITTPFLSGARQELIERLEALIITPPIKVSVSGSGIPENREQSIQWDALRIVSVAELEAAVKFLKKDGQ